MNHHPLVVIHCDRPSERPDALADLLTDIVTRLITIGTQLDANNQQGVQLMAKADDLNAKLDAIDTQTNEIAADIDALLANGLEGLTKDQADALAARLEGHVTTLQSIAAKA